MADRIETAPPAPGPGPAGPAANGCPFPHGGPAPSSDAGPVAEAEAHTGAAAVTARPPDVVPADVVPAELVRADVLPAAGGCPVPHGASVATDEDPRPLTPVDAGAAAASRCPVPHVAAAAPAAGCPILHGPGGVRRTPADLVVRKLLRIKDRPAGVSADSAYSTFQRSMLISATRCTLTYVVFPFVLPAAGFARGVGPVIGIIIGTIALACDTFTIRRFFAVDHKWRWHFSAIAFAIMCLLSVLLVQDVAHIVDSLLT